jgi:hypothetical protein
MKCNNSIPADTIKVVRHKIKKGHSQTTHSYEDAGGSAIYSTHINPYAHNDTLIEYDYVVVNDVEEPQAPIVETGYDSIRIVPVSDGFGNYMYLYLHDGDTILTDMQTEPQQQTEKPMITFYPSDTIKPSNYQFGTLSRYTVKYYDKPTYTTHKTSNDDVATIVYLPLMVLITIAYLNRCIINNSWGKLISDLRTAIA